MDRIKKITGIVLAGIIALAITACKVQPSGYVSLYVDNLASVRSTADTGETPLSMLDTAMTHVVDTTAVTEAVLPVVLQPVEEIFKILSDSVCQYEVKKLIKDIADSVQLLRHQMIELQKQLMEMSGKSFTGKKLQEIQPLDSQQAEVGFKQLIKAKDEQILMLQNQLNEIQTEAARTNHQAMIAGEAAKAPPPGSQQTGHLTHQLLQAKSDTIKLLRSQLQILQLPGHKKDTVFVYKDAVNTEPSNFLNLDTEPPVFFHALQDTILLLSNRLAKLEEQIFSGKNAPVITIYDLEDFRYRTESDTTHLVAFYELGKIKPLDEDLLLQQIEELCSNNKVAKITLSGYTDCSGNEKVNKEITTLRLNYLSEILFLWIAKEKVYFQNFGDTFASEKIINNERRVEIRIFTE